MTVVSAVTGGCLLSGLLALPPAAAAGMAEVAVFDVPPAVDGAIDDLSWERATPITALTQVHPASGAPPSLHTEVRFGADHRMLYIMVRAFDSEPGRIAAHQLQRDADLATDDHVTIVLDPLRSGRNGFLFRVNANGAQQDGLVYDGVEVRTDWDGVWEAGARVDAAGWSAEVAIPLALLSADGGGAAWGLNVERRIPRFSEIARWAGFAPDREVSSLADAGTLTRIPSASEAVGLRVQPRVSMRASSGARNPRESALEPGIDLFYRVKPGVTAVASVNADFAEAEVDERVVNLTRFPLFVSEKRAFFLQDAGLFSFGGLDTSPLPYYSRRIGLGPNGEPLAVDMGIKLTAETGGFDLGVLGARIEAPEGGETAEAGVLRLAGATSAHTRLGIIATTGNPEGTEGSRLAGVDYHYRNTRFAGDRIVDADAWIQQSRNAGLGRDEAMGVSLNYPNLGLTGDVSLQRIGEDFLPALGFVQETGVRQGSGSVGYWWRTTGGVSLIPAVDWSARGGLNDRRSSNLVNPELYLESAAGDYVFLEVFRERERLLEPFEILPGIVIPADEYEWDYRYFGVGTAPTRPWSVETEMIAGEFYDGRRRYLWSSSKWRLNRHLGLEIGYVFNDIDLPAGRFIVREASLRADVNVTVRHAGNLVLQWDNVSEQLGLNARLRWTVAPGRDLYLVIDQLMNAADGYSNLATDMTFKIVWNWLL